MSEWAAGDSFFLAVEGSHLHFLLHEFKADRVVVLNFITLTDYVDPPCLIEPGEHPFATKTTSVELHRAKLWPLDKLIECEENGSLTRSNPVPESIRSRILGAINQPNGLDPFHPSIREFLRTHGFA